MLVFAPLLFVLLNQLVTVDKMEAHEMQSAAIVLGGAHVVSASWMAARFVLSLVPERRRLDALIAQYEAS